MFTQSLKFTMDPITICMGKNQRENVHLTIAITCNQLYSRRWNTIRQGHIVIISNQFNDVITPTSLTLMKFDKIYEFNRGKESK